MPTSEAEKKKPALYEDGATGATPTSVELQKGERFSVASAVANTGIVIVNWNSWGETIEALEAVFKLNGFNGPVIVCDNASRDDSVKNITSWASGRLCALPENNAPEIYSLVVPPAKKTFQYRSLGEEDLEQIPVSEMTRKIRLWIVKAKENRGFAAGNNIGLRFLRRIGSIKWFWLLNNDAVASPHAYKKMMECLPITMKPIIAGGALLEYWNPQKVQACGATFNPFLFSMSNNLQGISTSELNKKEKIIPISYPVGASIIVNRSFLDQVGLMCEDYFLYYEEIDWVMRHSWPSKAFVITSSHIYHKGGKSTGAGNECRKRPLMADYYFIRSRIIFARKYGLLKGATVVLVTAIAVARRALRLKRGILTNALTAILDGVNRPGIPGESEKR